MATVCKVLTIRGYAPSTFLATIPFNISSYYTLGYRLASHVLHINFNIITLFYICRTCFYVLGLIATTRQGADILKSLNWESVRHKEEDRWPAVEVKEEALPYSKWFVSSLAGLNIKNFNKKMLRCYIRKKLLQWIAYKIFGMKI